MKLRKMYIRRIDYFPDQGHYTGTIEFDSDLGKIELNLSAELSNALMAILADKLVSIAKVAAEQLRVEIFESAAIAQAEKP